MEGIAMTSPLETRHRQWVVVIFALAGCGGGAAPGPQNTQVWCDVLAPKCTSPIVTNGLQTGCNAYTADALPASAPGGMRECIPPDGNPGNDCDAACSQLPSSGMFS